MKRPQFNGTICLLLLPLLALLTTGLSAEQNPAAASGPADPKNSGFAGLGSVAGTLKSDSEVRVSAPAGVDQTEGYFRWSCSA